MKKIATLTFHNCNNYGAVLQAYALQQTILKAGFDTEIINYTRDNMHDVFIMLKTKIKSISSGKPDKQLYTIKEFCDMVFKGEGNTKDISEAFTRFRKTYLKLSQPVSRKTIKTIEPDYSRIIVGSDQVWNCGRVNIEPTYMLDFVSDSNKKASYAPSFGINKIPDKYKEIYESLLSDFSFLSVREEQGASIIMDLIGKKAEVVLDPTFLLNKSDWMKLKIDVPTDRYILVYQLEISERLMNFARQLSDSTGIKLRYIRKPKVSNFEYDYCEGIGPDEWVAQFLGAEYIITNSFHGAAFSINFNKNFYVEISQDRIRGAMSSRLENLINTFKLTGRFISDVFPENFDEAIDYSKANQILKVHKDKSIKYLYSILNY